MRHSGDLMKDRGVIGLSEACLGQAEMDAACEVIRSGWISQGEKVRELEAAFEARSGLSAVAVSSCTGGLHATLSALDIGPGDEVLVPGVTFVATVNTVLYTGATPVPVDIQPGIPHMSIEAAQSALTKTTRAVVVMHYGGYQMDMSIWSAFARDNGLILVEDAAHCPGLSGVGTNSDAAVLSFFANKNMTTAEGGLILTRDASLSERLRRMRGHGMTTSTLSRAAGHAHTYDVDLPGWNYRMDDIRAAVGIAQLAKLDEFNEKRRHLSAVYRSLMAEKTPMISIPFSAEWPSVAHLMPVFLPLGTDRQKLMDFIRKRGIQTSIHYPIYHHFTWHSRLLPNVNLPFAEDWSARTLSLPLHPGMEENDVEYVVENMAAFGWGA